MSLIDANALINLIDQKQPRSAEFRRLFNTLRRPLHTIWPAFTEAMYLFTQDSDFYIYRFQDTRAFDVIP